MQPFDIFGILSLTSVIGFGVGICMAGRGQEIGHLVKGISCVGLMFFGTSWACFSFGERHQQEFLTQRDKILPLLSVAFDKSCDRKGVIEYPEMKHNCREDGGLRVWRDGSRIYAASLIGPSAVIDLIVDEDMFLAGSSQSIIHLAPQLDFRRLEAFARYAE